MQFTNFSDFYSHYLKAHENMVCRRFHFIGTCSVIALLLLFFFTGKVFILSLIPFVGYGLAWVGHFLFERNKPMTFKYPFYSLRGDFKMFWDILWGRIKAF
jgi:hypothetical protein